MTSKGGNSNYSNSTKIEEILKDSKSELGDINITEPIRILKRNWIDNVGDLRLLRKEKELKSLVQITDGLLRWLQSECDKVFFQAADLNALRDFVYKSDDDTNGIIYYLGTLRSKNKQWTNPALNGIVKVRMSSIMHDSQPPFAMIGRQSVRCVTKPEKNSYVVIDFAPRQIRPAHYTLRHYSTWDTEALRSWKLEAAMLNDNVWDVLSHHRNDAALNVKGATNTWKISNVQKFYSRFRIFQTDFNSNRHYYLSLSGFEIYGKLRDAEAGSDDRNAANNASLTFMHMNDFDSNGIVYWLGTNRKTEAWKNPALRGLIRIGLSSISKDSAPSYAVVGRDTVRCVTEPKKLSWAMIDFKFVKIIPTHYSVRHYSSFDTECLRNWRFEASNDTTDGIDGHWQLLLNHQNDTSLNQKGGTFTWPIPAENVNEQAFSKFRLYQYGVNSNQHHYLACSGFELYGTVISGQEAAIMNDDVPAGASRKFVHAFDMDTNGLFYFLGVKGGSVTQWVNPAEQGFVTVSSSSLMSDSQPLSCVVGRSEVRTVTKPHQRSWIAINLKNIRMCTTHYSIRHYNSWDTEALRHWNFEGSNDGQSWLPIRQHVDDRSLRKAGMFHTWTVDSGHYFSQFRLYMTGRNSNNHWYLACSGLELYGTAVGGLVSQYSTAVIANNNNNNANVAAAAAQYPPPPMNMNMNQRVISQAKTFNYSSDFDTNGLVYYLGTTCNTSQWQNPAQTGLVNIRTSGLMHDSAPSHAFIGRQVVRAVTRPQKQAWVVIDFVEYAICPTRYSLRHYSSWDTEALRNWRFEGSLDGERWVLIREHKNDPSLHSKGQAFTWQIRNCDSHFSMFRIFQFDKNSNQHYYLSLSGFEIYGSVVRRHSSLQWDSWPRNKSKKLQVDAMRNTVSNTGSEDTWQTCKSRQALNFSTVAIQEFSVLVERSEKTSNQWKFMVGLAPDTFSCTGSRQWLGSQLSWAYIGGTGGKCYNASKSLPYGEGWGTKAGDLITCIANLQHQNIEFIKNGQTQGVAFANFTVRNAFAAVSLTATGARIRLVERVTPQTGPVRQPQMQQQQQPQMAVGQLNNQFQGLNMQQMAPQAAFQAQNMGVAFQVQQQQQQQQMQMQMQQQMQQQQQSMNVLNGWDRNMKSPNLDVLPDGITVTNRGSNDTWQGIIGTTVWASGDHSFEIEIVKDCKTSNSWKFTVGVVPMNFNPKKTAWLGSQGSWGYIGGTGGKCHTEGKSVAYGQRFEGFDRIRCAISFQRGTIEFLKNGKSQGVAFNNLKIAIRPAVSFTGKDSLLRIVNVQ